MLLLLHYRGEPETATLKDNPRFCTFTIISEIYQRTDKSQLLEPPELADLINTNNIVQKYLPKQTEIDKILKIIQRKV